MAVQFREYVNFFSCDDKCKVDVGEPNMPIAAVSRGKQVSYSKTSYAPSYYIVMLIAAGKTARF